MFCRADSAIAHTRAALFNFFQNVFRLAGRFEKMKKSRERVCNSTISMVYEATKHYFFILLLIQINNGHTGFSNELLPASSSWKEV